jgi:hypothetical protein
MSGSWTCSRCGVTATFGPGATVPTQPEGWEQSHGEWLCLGCRRAEVADAAASADEPDRSARRRRALTEFELLRDPSATDQLIAKRVRCPTAFVRPVRAALLESGRLNVPEP